MKQKCTKVANLGLWVIVKKQKEILLEKLPNNFRCNTTYQTLQGNRSNWLERLADNNNCGNERSMLIKVVNPHLDIQKSCTV